MRTQDAKNIHCIDYMSRINAKFARTQQGTHGLEYVYHSTVREDRKPSLCINLDRNIWSDVPAGEGGRLIELVCYTNDLLKTDVSSALEILDKLFPEYRGRSRTFSEYRTPNHSVQSIMSLSNFEPVTQNMPKDKNIKPNFASTSLNKKNNAMELVSVKEIYRYPLKNYLAERKISLEIAQKYLHEIEYKNNQETLFYALGWKAGETYGLRTKNFKGFLGKGVDISVFDRKTTQIMVFEGMFDFLSYLSFVKSKIPAMTVIVLNSVVMHARLKDWISAHSEIDHIHCYFDNDMSGQKSFKELSHFFSDRNFIDHSEKYKFFKDYADWYEHK